MSSLYRVLTSAAVLAALAAGSAAQAYTVAPFSAPGIANPGYASFVSGVLDAKVDDVDVKWNSNADGHGHGAYQLTIQAKTSNTGVFNFPSAAYTIGNESIKLTANFDSTGHLITSMANTYEIDGSVAAWNSPSYGSKPSGVNWNAVPVQDLFSVNLTSFAVDSTHEALGFSTNHFGGWANQKQFTGGGSPTESLWLYGLISTGNVYCVLPRPGNNCNNSPNSNGTGTLPFTTSNSTWNTFLSELKNHSNVKSATFWGIGEIATVPLPAAVWLLGGGLALLVAFRRRPPELAATPA